MFTDNLKLAISAGKGGNGCIAWRREKYVPKGGPYGGDGGRGGSIIFKVDERLFSFENIRFKKKFIAENGKDGSSNNKKGRNGEDLIIKVPAGTIIKNSETKEEVFSFDLRKDNNPFILCKGGNGGFGNTRFKTPQNQAPHIATPGEDGQALNVELELKIIADIGLVGFPNAGKSTFLKSVTNARVKIADYPFTTLAPNLGKLKLDNDSEIFIADIPGIIENAHKNKGLGLSFLRHIERTFVLLFIIDISPLDQKDPIEEFEILKSEILSYNPTLLEKPFLIALNKIDLEVSEDNIEKFIKKYPNLNIFPISAINKENLSPLLNEIKKNF